MTNITGGGTGLPVYFVGKRWNNCTVVPLTQNTDGTFAKSTGADFCTALTAEYARFLSDTESEMIRPANWVINNDVIVANAFTVELGEIKLANQANNFSFTAYGSFDYALITVMESPDGGTTKNYVQAVAVRKSLSDEYSQGKSVVGSVWSNAGLPIAISTGSPTWS